MERGQSVIRSAPACYMTLEKQATKMVKLSPNEVVDESNPSRMLFDVSTLARWAGPPVGIIRVEHELARWAAEHTKHVVFVFFDLRSGVYREVNKKWLCRS